MKIIINSTTKIIHLNGIPARVWEGETASGIKVHCYITRIAIDADETHAEEFENELRECREPSVELNEIPIHLII